MSLLVLCDPGCSGQNPESSKWLCVYVWKCSLYDVLLDEPLQNERESVVSLSSAVNMEASCMESEVEHQIMFSDDELLTTSADPLDSQHQELASQISSAGVSFVDCLFHIRLRSSSDFSALTWLD